MTPLHKTALDYAQAGIAVFPCEPGGKRPAGRWALHGFHDRTTEAAVIERWYAEADYNLALVPADLGCYVVDVDDLQAWRDFCIACNQDTIDPRIKVRTPRGGLHLYFFGTARPNAGRIARGIDVRGQDSYVLVPPSVVDGRYYVRI